MRRRAKERYDNDPEYRERGRERARRRYLRKCSAEGSHTLAQFHRLCHRADNRCLCCGKPFTSKDPPTRDHILPLSRGGSDDISNIQPLCMFCNDSKGVRTTDYRPDPARDTTPSQSLPVVTSARRHLSYRKKD